MRKHVINYLIAFIVGAILAIVVFWVKGVFFQISNEQTIRYLADGFSYSGILILGSGLLVLAANHGTFDMLSYAGKKAGMLFVPQVKKNPPRQTFLEYKQMKKDKKSGFLHLIVIGGLYLLIAIGLIIVHLKIY